VARATGYGGPVLPHGDRERPRKVARQSGEKAGKERPQDWSPDAGGPCLSAEDAETCALVVESSGSAFIVSAGCVLLGCSLSCGIMDWLHLGCMWCSQFGWVCPQALASCAGTL
jgi:hypothetical protein